MLFYISFLNIIQSLQEPLNTRKFSLSMFSDQKLWRHGERCRSIRTRSTTFPPEPSVSARRTRKRCIEQIFCSLMEEQPSSPFVNSKRSSPQQRCNDSTPTSLLKALHVAVLPLHTQRSSSAAPLPVMCTPLNRSAMVSEGDSTW